MKRARDFRHTALNLLKGKWKLAVLVGFVASLLGISEGITINFDVYNNNPDGDIPSVIGRSIGELISGFPFLSFLIAVLFILTLCICVAFFILGSVADVGYAKFNLNLFDGNSPDINNLFAYFPYWKRTACLRLLRGFHIFLMSLLLIIPGIITALSYSMSDYIMAENPELTASQALERSKELMEGNRWRYFCLEFSFIGWFFLNTFTMGIGGLWLVPYTKLSYTAFYREITVEKTIGEDFI